MPLIGAVQQCEQNAGIEERLSFHDGTVAASDELPHAHCPTAADGRRQSSRGSQPQPHAAGLAPGHPRQRGTAAQQIASRLVEQRCQRDVAPSRLSLQADR